MLRVAAFEIRHPVPLIVLVKGDNGARNARQFIIAARHVSSSAVRLRQGYGGPAGALAKAGRTHENNNTCDTITIGTTKVGRIASGSAMNGSTKDGFLT